MFVEEKTIKTLSRTGGHAEESLKSLPSESGSNVLSSDRTLISLRFPWFERAINTFPSRFSKCQALKDVHCICSTRTRYFVINVTACIVTCAVNSPILECATEEFVQRAMSKRIRYKYNTGENFPSRCFVWCCSVSCGVSLTRFSTPTDCSEVFANTKRTKTIIAKHIDY